LWTARPLTFPRRNWTDLYHSYKFWTYTVITIHWSFHQIVFLYNKISFILLLYPLFIYIHCCHTQFCISCPKNWILFQRNTWVHGSWSTVKRDSIWFQCGLVFLWLHAVQVAQGS
jgi:hypothetical protein